MIGKLKKPLYWIVILFVGTLASVVGKEIGGQLLSPSDKDVLGPAIRQAAKKLNEQAPKKVDEETTLLRAEQGAENELVTYFELKDFDKWGATADLSAGKAFVVKSLCARPQTIKTMQMGAVYSYVYLKEGGKEVYRFKVSRSDCP